MTKGEMYLHLIELAPTSVSVSGKEGEVARIGTVVFQDFAVDVRDLTEEELKCREEYEAWYARAVWDEEKGWIDPENPND